MRILQKFITDQGIFSSPPDPVAEVDWHIYNFSRLQQSVLHLGHFPLEI